jgi:hypothetical protein
LVLILNQGGTANLAVLTGNLPVSRSFGRSRERCPDAEHQCLKALILNASANTLVPAQAEIVPAIVHLPNVTGAF